MRHQARLLSIEITIELSVLGFSRYKVWKSKLTRFNGLTSGTPQEFVEGYIHGALNNVNVQSDDLKEMGQRKLSKDSTDYSFSTDMRSPGSR